MLSECTKLVTFGLNSIIFSWPNSQTHPQWHPFLFYLQWRLCLYSSLRQHFHWSSGSCPPPGILKTFIPSLTTTTTTTAPPHSFWHSDLLSQLHILLHYPTPTFYCLFTAKVLKIFIYTHCFQFFYSLFNSLLSFVHIRTFGVPKITVTSILPNPRVIFLYSSFIPSQKSLTEGTTVLIFLLSQEPLQTYFPLILLLQKSPEVGVLPQPP